jgi:hypothetical protein
MKSSLLGLVSAVILTVGLAPQAAIAASTVAVSMPCSDPSGSLAVNTDQATADGVATAVQGMVASGTGLNCSVSESAATTQSTAKSFAVGGGQFLTGCGTDTFTANFSFDAHSDPTNGNVHGTVNLTFPDNPCFPVSHETATVTCLVVVGNTATFSAQITKKDGAFVNNVFIEGHATDNGNPQSGVPDTLSLFGALTDPACAFQLPGQFPITNGNIVVRQST